MKTKHFSIIFQMFFVSLFLILLSREDDDINDVATMGGVNLSEETRNIMATNAEFIGTQTRSCKDECFLYHSPLSSKTNAIGMLPITIHYPKSFYHIEIGLEFMKSNSLFQAFPSQVTITKVSLKQ